MQKYLNLLYIWFAIQIKFETFLTIKETFFPSGNKI